MRSLHALVIVGVALVLAGGLSSCSKAAPEAKAPPPMPATVVKAESRDIPDIRSYPGNTEAIYAATVVARIEGFLEERLFEEGTDVQEGALLFIIEQPPYEAAVISSKASVLDAEVMLSYARMQYERNEPLAKSGAISQQEWDEYVRNLESSVAQLEEAEAALIQSQINFEYTEVRAPFAGRMGRRYVDVGNLVGPGTNENLALLVDLNPMRVVFEPAGTELVDYLKAWPKTKVPVTVTFQSDTGPEVMKGELELVDNTLNSGTSTFIARAQFENPEKLVLPGLYADVQVTIGTLKNSIVVPGEAIYSELQSHYVWSVDSKDQLVRNNVTLGVSYEGMRIVTGIKAGVPVIVEGNPYMLHPGTKVNATTTSIDAFLEDQKKKAAENTKRTEGSGSSGSSGSDPSKTSGSDSKAPDTKSEKNSTKSGSTG